MATKTYPWTHLILGTAFLCVTAIGTTHAQNSETISETISVPLAPKVPFEPQLTLNEAPKACGLFLDHLKDVFRTGKPYRGSYPSTPKISAWEDSMEWKPLASDRGNIQVYSAIDILEGDFNNDGKPDALMRYNHFFNIYEVSDLYFVENLSYLLDQVKNDVDAKISNLPWGRDSIRIEASPLLSSQAVGAKQIGGGSDRVLGRHAPFLFKIDGQHFVYAPDSWTGRMWKGDPSLQRLTPDLELKTVCRATMTPEWASNRAFFGNQRGPETKGQQSLLGPSFQTFTKAINAELGAPANCKSRSDADFWHREEMRSSILDVLFRPWTLGPVQMNASPQTPVRSIWRYDGLWEYRAERTLAETERLATSDLADWYKSRFGYAPEIAMPLARNGILTIRVKGPTSISTERFLENLPEDAGENLKDYLDFQRKIALAHRPRLTKALLDGEDEAVVNGMISNIEVLTRSNTLNETPLFFALEHPNLVTLLLSKGADLNPRNHFGKTPLMYAAQFGLKDSVDLLLKHGADPNLVTTQKQDTWCNPLRYLDRTALMYALENAETPGIVERLLAAGADASAHDKDQNSGGGGRTMQDYLALNDKMSDQNKEAVKERLQQAQHPGFDCAKAGNVIERAICADAAVASVDSQLNRLYRFVRTSLPDTRHDSLKSSQLAWWQDRNSTCRNQPPETLGQCVIQKNRTRMKGLRQLLKETAVATSVPPTAPPFPAPPSP